MCKITLYTIVETDQSEAAISLHSVDGWPSTWVVHLKLNRLFIYVSSAPKKDIAQCYIPLHFKILRIPL